MPDDLRLPNHTDESVAYRTLCKDWAFDPDTRTLHVQNPDDEWGRYALDLGPAFDAAAELGPRTGLEDAGEGVRSFCRYRVADGEVRFWAARTQGREVHVFQAAVGEAPEPNIEKAQTPADAAARVDELAQHVAAEGYVLAQELSIDDLRAMGCTEFRSLEVGEEVRGDPPESRLGGTPTAGAIGEWPTTETEPLRMISYHLPPGLNFWQVPEADREEVLSDLREQADQPEAPMGFLLQVATGNLLRDHAGIAVFVAIDGAATEHAVHNKALLIPREQWGRPSAPPPEEDPPVLPVQTLRIGDAAVEFDETRIQPLLQADPELAGAFEKLHATLDAPDSGVFGKLGGSPTWVQSPDIPLGKDRTPYRFLLQIDFDEVHGLDQAWPDAGLFGVLYVFVTQEEHAAMALWQYT